MIKKLRNKKNSKLISALFPCDLLLINYSIQTFSETRTHKIENSNAFWEAKFFTRLRQICKLGNYFRTLTKFYLDYT